MLNDGKKDYTFTSCGVTGTSFVCNEVTPEIIEGTYKIKSITGTDYQFIFTDDIKNKELIYKKDFIGESTIENPKKINPEVETTQPTNIYLGNDESKEVTTCTIDSTNKKIYHCKIALEDYNELTDISIYYMNSCGKIIDSGITIQIAPMVATSVTSIKLGDTTFSTTDITTVTLIVKDSPNSDIRSIEFTDSDNNKKTFDQSCSHVGTSITCRATEANKLSSVGVYTLSAVNSIDRITVPVEEGSLLTVEIKEDVKILGEQTETAPTINNDTKSFTIVVDNAITEGPKIYCGKELTQEIQCELSGTNLVCTPTESNMPESSTYNIYYANV